MNYARLIAVCFLLGQSVVNTANAFTLQMDGDSLPVGTTLVSRNYQINNHDAFTSDGSRTVISNKYAYSGNNSIEMSVVQGRTGFGMLGGIINLANCTHKGGRVLRKGDEVWVRLRIYLPPGFEYNRNGRNKFLRFRVFDANNNSEGYNDLYLNGWASTFYEFIFEGAQKWYKMTAPPLVQGKWETVEFYLKLDNIKGSQGGSSMVQVWLNGNLVGETNDRRTLNTANSYVKQLNVFTYWDDAGAHKTQYLYVDDFVLTTDTPSTRDV